MSKKRKKGYGKQVLNIKLLCKYGNTLWAILGNQVEIGLHLHASLQLRGLNWYLLKAKDETVALNMGVPVCGPYPTQCWGHSVPTDLTESLFLCFLGTACHVTGFNLLSLILSHSHYVPFLPTDNPMALFSLYHFATPIMLFTTDQPIFSI